MKFRFWCEECKKMIYPHDINSPERYFIERCYLDERINSVIFGRFSLENNSYEYWSGCGSAHYSKLESIKPGLFHPHIMMQSTSSKDDHDVEIWQDDIVCFGVNKVYKRMLFGLYKTDDFCDSCGDALLENDCEYTGYPLSHPLIPKVVAGNWHENPELRGNCR
jgi:hypothetical protein